MATALLTGYPGQLAVGLLPRLLRRDPGLAVVCLVQSRFHGAAAERVAALPEALAGRVELVEGDVTLPDLGLGDRRADLARRLTQVFHLAAAYDLELPRDVGLRVNVAGTRHVVHLCADSPGLRRLHHVSTCYVSGRWAGIFREEDLDKGQRFNNAYEESKHLAEALVAHAGAGGMPVTVHRPAVVGGDAATGATEKLDGLFLMFRLLLRQPGTWSLLPLVGDVDAYRFNVVPRDFVVEAIDALAAREDTVGGTFALADPEPPTVRELAGMLGEAAGKRLVGVPTPRRATRAALRWVPGLRRLVGIPPAAVDYYTHPTHYTTDAAAPLLAEAGVALPDRRRWLAAMAAFAAAHPGLPTTGMR